MLTSDGPSRGSGFTLVGDDSKASLFNDEDAFIGWIVVSWGSGFTKGFCTRRQTDLINGEKDRNVHTADIDGAIPMFSLWLIVASRFEYA